MKTPEQWIILISTPIYVILIGLEMLLTNFRRLKGYTVKDTLINFLFMVLNALVDLAFRFIYLAVLVFFFNHRLLNLDSDSWQYWLWLFVLEDFVYYWLHYFDHHVRLFWAVHVTHHSSEYFNLSTGFRSSIFQPLYRFIYFIPLVLLGFKPLDILLIYSITQIYGILVHTEFNIRLGWLEYLLVTPSHHRVHHASNVIYLDKNLGMCLIIWDKLFGTFQAEEATIPPVYGLTKAPEIHLPTDAVLHEFKAIFRDSRRQSDPGNRIKVWLKPPGWSADGSTKTSVELQREYWQQHGGHQSPQT